MNRLQVKSDIIVFPMLLVGAHLKAPQKFLIRVSASAADSRYDLEGCSQTAGDYIARLYVALIEGD